MQQLEQDRRNWEAKMQEERQHLDERLAQSNKELLAGLERERRAWEQDNGKWPTRLVLAVIILAIAEVMGNVPRFQRFLGLD